MKNRVIAILGLALVVAPLIAGTAQAKGGGCNVVYYGSTGPVCEAETGPSRGGKK
jgi:hypothetical protein